MCSCIGDDIGKVAVDPGVYGDFTGRIHKEFYQGRIWKVLNKIICKTLCGTKFEFGTDDNGKVYLIDEVLTPDSSRYWPADKYEIGRSQPSYDKQYVRDWLETLDWNKQAPGPVLPNEVVANTIACYSEALTKLMS